MTYQPEGFQPGGYQPEGFQPQYVVPGHSAVGLTATVRSIGRRTVSSSFSLISGNTVKLEFTVSNDDGAVDISTDTIRFALVKGFQTVISTDDSTATVVLSEPAQGKFQVHIADENTVGLIGTYRFQAEVEDPAGDKATVARGYITFSENLLATAS